MRNNIINDISTHENEISFREVSKEDVEAEDKHGAVQFRLPGSPFVLNAGKDSATIGKVFAKAVRVVRAIINLTAARQICAHMREMTAEM